MIRGHKLLLAGLLLLLAVTSTIFLPGTRDLWRNMWRHLRPPGPAVVKPPDTVGGTCFRCHESMLDKLNKRAVHRPFAEGRCDVCHTRHDAKTFVTRLTAGVGEMCGSKCHSRDLEKYAKMSAQHVPYKKEWCTACHDPHGSDYESVLRMNPSRICLTCHNMNLRYGAKPVQHPPFKQRACLACHVPHASDNPKNTRLPLPYLCMNCHPIIARDMAASVLHPPFSQAWCVACHNPHAENHPRMVKAPKDSTQPFVDLCFTCHGSAQARLRAIDLHISHPVGGKKVDPITGKQLTCVSCHHPHGTNNPRMWKRDRDYLCLGCHRRLTGRFNMPW